MRDLLRASTRRAFGSEPKLLRWTRKCAIRLELPPDELSGRHRHCCIGPESPRIAVGVHPTSCRVGTEIAASGPKVRGSRACVCVRTQSCACAHRPDSTRPQFLFWPSGPRRSSVRWPGRMARPPRGTPPRFPMAVRTYASGDMCLCTCAHAFAGMCMCVGQREHAGHACMRIANRMKVSSRR